MKKIALGSIGCGIAARELHLPALQKLASRFEITAVCNHTEAKAKSMAQMAGGVDQSAVAVFQSEEGQYGVEPSFSPQHGIPLPSARRTEAG